MQRSAKGLLMVESQVPYSTAIFAWLILHGLPFTDLEKPSRWFDRQFLAWETVRRVRNPFFVEGTGFEGYFIGQCDSAYAMMDRLLAIGRDMLASHARLYRFNPGFRARLMRALTDETGDVAALFEWSALLGATLARLRCQALGVPEAATFQSETYHMTNALPGIRYTQCDHTVNQAYTLPYPTSAQQHKLAMSLETLNAGDQEAAFVAWRVGRLGHPLVRQFLSERARSPL